MKESVKRKPTLLQAILPILVLVGMIVVNVFLIEDDPLDGPSQIALIFAAIVAGACAMFNGVTWEEISNKIENTIASAITSIIILLVIGMLAGSWMISGVIPSMIHYGLFILKPSYFLPATVLIASIVSVATGSSWSTIATVGVALLSIGNALGFSSPMVAGAIISGAYFGDKISPMSDTTNLASATAKTNLFTHIKYMLHTSVPAILITLIIFLIISLSSGASSEINAGELQRVIKSTFNVNPLLFIVPVLVIYLIVKKVPAVITLLTGSILAAIFAVIFQGDLLERMTDGSAAKIFGVVMRSMYGDMSIATGDPAVDELFSTGGMAGMLGTVWLIFGAMIFGGVMEAGGFLNKITETLLKRVKSDTALVSTTTASSILFNVITADQYISIVLTGKLFSDSFEKHDLAPEVLSRTIEDSATVSSVLIPWNSCGATQARVLGVATVAYLPYCFFCYLSPVINILFVLFKIKLRKRIIAAA